MLKINIIGCYYAHRIRVTISRSKHPIGETIFTAYHLDGEAPRQEVIDARGVKTSTTYDAFGHPILEQCYDLMGQLVEEIKFAYDVNGNRILREVITEKHPVKTEWKYNALNRLEMTVEAVGTPDQKIIERKYDAAGNLKMLIKNDGIVLSYTYDALGRKRTLKSSDGALSYSYRYDNNDNLVRAQDEINGTAVHRTYTFHDELNRETLPAGHTLAYSYDYLGKIRRITLPDGTKIRYEREGDRLVEIQREGPLSYSFGYTKYDQMSNPTQMRLPAQAGNLKMDYDLLNRPTSIRSSHWKETLEYEKQLLESCTLHDAFGKTVSTYTYDAREQLLSEKGAFQNQFGFDWQGNIKEQNGHSREFTARNALVKERKHSYSYDLNGNRTSDGVNTYTYDSLDRLIEARTPSGIYKYTYDSLGRRIASTHKQETTHFLWQQQQEIGIISSAGKIKELQVLNPINKPVAFELQEKLYIPITDQFGHVRTLLDSKRNCVSTYRYSAFGKEEIKGKVLSPWRYAGKRIDAETGLIYFGERFYDPKTFCWMTPDPLEDVDGPNYYRYLKNNPLYYVDPDGRWVLPAIYAAGTAVVEFFTVTWGGSAAVATAGATIGTTTAAATTASTVVVSTITAEAFAGAAVGLAAGTALYQGTKYLDGALNKDGEKKSEKDVDRDKLPYDGEFLGENPEVCPQEGFKWKGSGKPGSRGGAYWNDETKESLRPHLDGIGHKPHWDYTPRKGPKARLNTDGTWERKK